MTQINLYSLSVSKGSNISIFQIFLGHLDLNFSLVLANTEKPRIGTIFNLDSIARILEKTSIVDTCDDEQLATMSTGFYIALYRTQRTLIWNCSIQSHSIFISFQFQDSFDHLKIIMSVEYLEKLKQFAFYCS